MNISIIVPIYKVEKYLCRCIDSILKQTFSDYELILVDDGSPDKCSEICDEYAAKDDRIKVIHKKNGGLSDARNAGLHIASGEFVAFVDSDDWVTTDYLETLYNCIINEDADICECGIIRTTGEVTLSTIEVETVNSYSTQEALKLLIEDKVFHQHVWNKLYRRSIFNGILFPVNKTNEDEFWTYQVFGNAKKVVSTNRALYYYYQRSDSIMGCGYDIKRLDAIEAKVLRQAYIELNFPELKVVAKRSLFGSCIYAGQMSLLHLKNKDMIIAKNKLNDAIRETKISLIDCMTAEGNNKIWFALAYFAFWDVCKIKNLLKKGF